MLENGKVTDLIDRMIEKHGSVNDEGIKSIIVGKLEEIGKENDELTEDDLSDIESEVDRKLNFLQEL